MFRANFCPSVTVIVACRWFLYYLTYIDDARSNTNQVVEKYLGSQVEMCEETHIVIHIQLSVIAFQFERTLEYIDKCY